MPNRIFALAIGAALLPGCASPPPSQQKLSSAYSELSHATPNYASIMTAADTYLAEQPTGPAAADDPPK